MYFKDIIMIVRILEISKLVLLSYIIYIVFNSMGFFGKLFNKTLTGKFIHTVSATIQYIKDYNLVEETFHSKEFMFVLRKYLNVPFKKDWIGRLYAVINPNINIDGNLDFNNAIIEIDGDNSNNNDQVRNWIFRQMHMIGDLFKLNNMYDYISVDIKHVGPKDADNYLVVFDITSRQDMSAAFKAFMKHFFVYAILTLIGIVTFTII